MGYRVGVNCYSTEQEANDAYYSGINPYVLVSSTNTTIFRWEKYPDNHWYYKKTTISSTGGLTNNFVQYQSPNMTYPLCDEVNQFNAVFAGEVFFAFFLPTVALWLVTKHIDIVIKAFKRF